MEITRGKIRKAVKVLIYGPEGIGKSTLASKFPDPVFIDTEGSTAHMDVSRFPAPSSWTMLMQAVQQVKDHPDTCRTLVIDTADWAEKLCMEHVCASHQMNSIEDAGYGKGYVYVKEEFGKLLNQLSDLLDRGINVVITAHAQMRKFEQPDELGAYDRWELKMSKQTAPLVKEWADMILFCNFKTYVVNVDNKGAQKGKNKVQGGKRVMYTSHHPCWDAKNRFGLPDELDMDYASIASVVPDLPLPAVQNQQEKPTEHEQVPDPVIPESVPEAKTEAKPEAKTEPEKKPMEILQAPAKKEVSLFFSDPDRLPKNLKDLMENDGISEWDIQAAVYAKGYYPENTLIQNMDPEFIDGWIVSFWPQVKELVKSIRDKEEIPFV